MMEWIKCSERLPEKEGRYLAYPNTIGEPGTALFWVQGHIWQDLEDHTEPWAPTHWMPLPERPTEEVDTEDLMPGIIETVIAKSKEAYAPQNVATYATGKFSPCCDELIRVGSSDEGTNWYECSKCGKAV